MTVHDRAMLPILPERYRCTRLLGEGATGVVYHAEDRLLHTEVAVKVVKTNLALHRRFRARFAREVAISARIVHPHVVPVHDTGMLPTGEPFVVLGYASGGSLADLVKKYPSIEDMLRLVDQVLDALAAIHARMLIHQDLKPSNVLLHAGTDGRAHAWVADLGVADALAELNRDRKVISGTPGYMAPEQLEGRTQDLGPWTDLYAIGLILYETLTGEKPHPGEGRAELLDARRRPPPPMKLGRQLGIPAALREVITWLLDPEPRQRFDRAADVRRALRDAIKGVSFRGRVRSWRSNKEGTNTTGPTRLTGDFPLSVPIPQGPVAAGTLKWNRVSPDAIPHDPPPERGWEAPARASLALFALREVPLVGRERERKVLWDAAREVIALGEPRVVLIVGESGTGKTRLVDSVSNAFEEQGYMEVTRLRYHSPPGVDDGYRGAVRDLLVPWNDTRDGIETRLSRWISRDRQVLPEKVHEEATVLARWCGYLREGETPVSDAVGLAYLYRFLDVRAWRGGSCLVLEDVHNAQADGDGLAIAEALLDRTVGERPVVCLCTLSAEALGRDAALRRKVEALQQRGARRINLRRLTLPETRRVVQESLLLEPELAQAVSLETEGDPLAAGLLLREWASRKLPVATPAGMYALPPSVTPDEAFPPDLDTIVRRRLQAALENCADPVAATETIAAISLAGQEPPVALIRAVNDAGLDALLATGLISEQRGYLVFEHSRIYQKALEMALKLPAVKSVHRRLADAWEGLGAATGLDVALPLGLHRLRSGEPERAVTPLLEAAANMNQGGRRDAIRAAAMAIEAADAVGQPTARLEARRLHAEALLEAGEPERALPLIEHALREVEGDRLARARLRVLLARGLRKQGDLDRAQKELESARNVFASLRDREGLMEVAVQRARLARVEGRNDNAIAYWTEVLRLNRGDLAMEAEALNGLCEALIRSGQLDTIDKQVERLTNVARASGDTRRIAEATATVGLLLMERGDFDQAKLHLTSAGAIAATLGADALHLRSRTQLADVHRFAGDYDAAEETTRWVVRFAGERAHHALVAGARVQLALLALARSEPRRVRQETEAAAEALQQSPRHGLWLQIGLLRAMLAAEAGDERMCRAWFAVAQERGLTAVQGPDLRVPIERLAAAADSHGWEDIVRRLAAQLDPNAPTPSAPRAPHLPGPSSLPEEDSGVRPSPLAREAPAPFGPFAPAPPAATSPRPTPLPPRAPDPEPVTPLLDLSDPAITAPRPLGAPPAAEVTDHPAVLDPSDVSPSPRRPRRIVPVPEAAADEAPLPLGVATTPAPAARRGLPITPRHPAAPSMPPPVAERLGPVTVERPDPTRPLLPGNPQHAPLLSTLDAPSPTLTFSDVGSGRRSDRGLYSGASDLRSRSDVSRPGSGYTDGSDASAAQRRAERLRRPGSPALTESTRTAYTLDPRTIPIPPADRQTLDDPRTDPPSTPQIPTSQTRVAVTPTLSRANRTASDVADGPTGSRPVGRPLVPPSVQNAHVRSAPTPRSDLLASSSARPVVPASRPPAPPVSRAPTPVRPSAPGRPQALPPRQRTPIPDLPAEALRPVDSKPVAPVRGTPPRPPRGPVRTAGGGLGIRVAVTRAPARGGRVLGDDEDDEKTDPKIRR